MLDSWKELCKHGIENGEESLLLSLGIGVRVETPLAFRQISRSLSTIAHNR